MIDQLDNDIRGFVARAGEGAPEPLPWADVLSRTNGHGASAASPPQHSLRWVFVAAAAAIVVLLGGLVVASRQRGDDAVVSSSAPMIDAAPDTEVRPLDSLPTEVVVVPPVLSPSTTVADGLPEPSRPLAIGSSVMLGAAEELNDEGFLVDAVENRFFREGLQVLERVAAEGAVPDTVIIGLADNGTIAESDLTHLLQVVLRTSNRVVFVTTSIDREYAAANNELLRALPSKYANVTILDWAADVADCVEDCLYQDGMHLRQAGQDLYARKAVDAVAARTPSTL